MKKIIAIIIAIVVMLSLGATCFADWNDYETLPDSYLLTTDYMWAKGFGPRFNADGTVTIWFNDKVSYDFSKEAIDMMYAAYYLWWTGEDYLDTHEIVYWVADNYNYSNLHPMSTNVDDVYFFGFRPFGALELGYNVVEKYDSVHDGITYKGFGDYITDSEGELFYDAVALQLINGVLEPIYLDVDNSH